MKKTEPASAKTQAAWAELTAALVARGGASGAMFGMPTVKAGGRAILGCFGDAIVFKLGGATHARALALRDAELFDPSGMGRPMKEWVVVPSAHASEWPALAEAAFEYGSTAAAEAGKAGKAKKKP
jgi:hypothetical protein